MPLVKVVDYKDIGVVSKVKKYDVCFAVFYNIL